MKRILNLVIALLICGNLLSQSSYKFRKPTSLSGGSSWKFTSVIPGVNAIVSITGSKNASIDQIDDSSSYPYAWNPSIKYNSATTHSYDSSYLEFTINFVKANGSASLQNSLAMTVIDCDGTLNYREMVKTPQPATSTGILGSVLSIISNPQTLTALGSLLDFGGLDTTAFLAMTQIGYSNITTYKMKVGVLGKVPANTVRQHSFYYKGFSALTVPLAVELISFKAELNNNTTELSWSTASEESLSRFEVCRSTDGKNFSSIGTVNANYISNEEIDYSFTDHTLMNSNSPVVYYRLKMINNDGSFKMSNVSQVKVSAALTTVSVYPNPTTEFVNVGLANADGADINISIIDAYGKTVQTEVTSNNSMQFDVKGLENGVYFINILNADGSTTSSKFIKR